MSQAVTCTVSQIDDIEKNHRCSGICMLLTSIVCCNLPIQFQPALDTDPLPPLCYFAKSPPLKEKKKRKKTTTSLVPSTWCYPQAMDVQCPSLVLVKHNSDFSLRHCDIPLIHYMLEVVNNIRTIHVKQIKYVQTCLLKGSFLCRICHSWHLLTTTCSYRLERIQTSPPHPVVQVHSSWSSYTECIVQLTLYIIILGQEDKSTYIRKGKENQRG